MDPFKVGSFLLIGQTVVAILKWRHSPSNTVAKFVGSSAWRRTPTLLRTSSYSSLSIF